MQRTLQEWKNQHILKCSNITYKMYRYLALKEVFPVEEVYTEHQSSIRCLLKGGPVTKIRQAFPSERSPSKLSVIISCVVWCSERGSSGRLVLCSLSLGAFLKGIYTRGRLLCSRCSLFLGALKGVPGKCLSVFAWWLVLLLQDMVCYFNVLYRLNYASSHLPFLLGNVDKVSVSSIG